MALLRTGAHLTEGIGVYGVSEPGVYVNWSERAMKRHLVALCSLIGFMVSGSNYFHRMKVLLRGVGQSQILCINFRELPDIRRELNSRPTFNTTDKTNIRELLSCQRFWISVHAIRFCCGGVMGVTIMVARGGLAWRAGGNCPLVWRACID